MKQQAGQLQLVTDGITSTSILVKHCLGEQVEMSGELYDVAFASPDDFKARRDDDAVYILIRVSDSDTVTRTHALVNSGRPYAYYIDDNFWLLLGDSALDRFYQNWSVRRALESAVSGASVILCHSQKFKEFLKHYNQNVLVVPTYFDFSCLDGLPLEQEDSGERRIGVVANSSRAEDLAIVVPAILSILAEFPDDVYVEFFGYMPPELANHPRIRFFEPITDYRTFIRTQYSRDWLIALAPLRETAFSSYKSNNKFREFGGCGVAGLYSDVEVYRESVEHGRTGWLVANCAQAWHAAMKEALLDRARTRQIGIGARAAVQQRHQIDHVRQSWLSAVEPMLSTDLGEKSLLNRFKGAVSALRSRFYHTPAMRIATNHGWVRPRRPTRPVAAVKGGFYEADVIFLLQPGDHLLTVVTAPVDGAFLWNFLLATFHALPKGKLELQLSGPGGQERVWEFSQEQLSDNTPFQLHVDLRADQSVEIRLLNSTDSALGLYALSPNGSTQYGSTGYGFPGRFIA